MNAPNSEKPSLAILWLSDASPPLQPRSSDQPKNGVCQPSGVSAAIVAGSTRWMAMTATITETTVISANFRTSVHTMLNMPPSTA